MQLKNTESNFILFLLGILQLLVAVFLFFTPFDNDENNLLLISISYIVFGLFLLIAYARNRKWYFRPGWTLQQSFFLLFFGIILLFSGNIDFETNNLVFCFLSFFTAATQLAASISLNSLDIRNHWLISVFAIVNIVFGVYFLLNPFSQYISITQSVAFYTFFQGICSLSEPFVYIKKGQNGRRDKIED